MSKYDVAIIGAGPAGMMAAITASGNAQRVVLIERNPAVGRKLLATGNGRCNLTNACVAIDRYHGGNLKFIETVLSQFDQDATMEFFRSLGLLLKEEDNGRIFPRTNQAASVVEVLRQRLLRNKVDIMLDARVAAIEKSESWSISLEGGGMLQSGKLIIATGGRAAHYLGSTGDGLFWAQRLGHSLTLIHAALVPIETVEGWPKDIQGIKVEAAAWATSGSQRLGESAGDVLFTSYGVSGPAVMALAGSIAPALKASTVQLHIDLFPDMTQDQLNEILSRILRSNAEKALEGALVGLLPSGLIPIVTRLGVKSMKNLTLTVAKLRPFKEAQVMAGGVDSAEVDPQTLESKLVKGLYFAGEILDADGDSGGFNLQWAWSSGRVAGRP